MAPPLPSSQVTRIVRTEDITVNDVLCGRGGDINVHVGNEHYRNIIESKRIEYLTSKFKREKRVIATKVVEAIHSLSPPGRFLSKIQAPGRKRGRSKGPDLGWNEIEYEKAIEKASQALRENAPSIRKKIVRQDQTEDNDDSDSDAPLEEYSRAQQVEQVEYSKPQYPAGTLQRLPSGAIQHVPRGVRASYHNVGLGSQPQQQLLPPSNALPRSSSTSQQMTQHTLQRSPSEVYQQFFDSGISQQLPPDSHQGPSLSSVRHTSIPSLPLQPPHPLSLENLSPPGSAQLYPRGQGPSLSSISSGPPLSTYYAGFWTAHAPSTQPYPNPYLASGSSQRWDASTNTARGSMPEPNSGSLLQNYASSSYYTTGSWQPGLHSSTSGSGQSSFDIQDRAAQGMVSLATSHQHPSAHTAVNPNFGSNNVSINSRAENDKKRINLPSHNRHSSSAENDKKRIKLSAHNQHVPLSPIRILRDGAPAMSPPSHAPLSRSLVSATMLQNYPYFQYPNQPGPMYGTDNFSLFQIPSLTNDPAATSQAAMGSRNRGETRQLLSHHRYSMDSPTNGSVEGFNSLEGHSL